MAGSKRERELARAKYERQQKRRAERAARQRRRNQIVAAVVVLAVVVGGITWFALANRSSTTPDDVAASATPSPTPEDTAASPSPTASGSEAVPTDCKKPAEVRADDQTFDAAPEDALKPGASYDITFATNCGKFVVATDPEAAPQTVNSMVFLAEQGYFDLTKCHRLTTAGIFVLQCGDPAGDGTGGPGYTIPDENLPAEGDANYPAGTVAMANAGPNTGGSQFFVVYEDTTLPGSYTIWGTVTKGLDVVKEIAGAGVEGGGQDGPPAQPVVIDTATVTRS